MTFTPNYNLRPDLLAVAEMVKSNTRVLDVGCGDGALLDYLLKNKHIDGRGIELSMEGVNACVAQGLSVVQGDADTDLSHYPTKAFDFVILSQTLQATRAPVEVLENLLRIGKRAIVSFPNFGYWRVRASLAIKGKMPLTKSLPDNWYNTPNIHFCTIKDFVLLCNERSIIIEKKIALNSNNSLVPQISISFGGNLMGEQVIFLIHRNE